MNCEASYGGALGFWHKMEPTSHPSREYHSWEATSPQLTAAFGHSIWSPAVCSGAMDEKNGMATLHDVLDAQSSVSAVTCRSPAVRSGATDEKNGMATLHDVLDAQWIYDNPARVSTLSSLPSSLSSPATSVWS